MNTIQRASLLALLLMLPVGCTFMGLDSIELPQCQSDEDCTMAFNERAGLYAECHAFACVPDGDRRTCQRIEGEICDGFDNDCDYVVDEANGGNAVFDPAVTMRIDTADGVRGGIDVSSDGDQHSLVSWSVLAERLNDSWTSPLDSAMPSATQLGYQTNADATNLASRVLTPADVPGTCGALGTEPRNCEISDVVRASGPYGTFTATINVDGCTAGLLRITETSPNLPAELIDVGPGHRSNLYRGVARVDGTACSANLSTACQTAMMTGVDVPTSCGVTLPSIAALTANPELIDPPPTPQALVAFIGAGEGTRTCDGSVAPVEILGAYRRGSTSGGIEWVDGVNEGVPVRVGDTKGRGRPAVLAITDAGFLVAHGDENGNLAIHFVAAAAEPPANFGLDCGAGVPCNATTAEARTGVETPEHGAITDFEVIHSVTMGEGVDEVQLSLGRVNDTTLEIGMSFREGCVADDAALYFRRLVLDISTSPPTLTPGAAALVNVGKNVQGPSALIHVDEGFLAEGFAGSDATAGPGDLGGFFVAWPSNGNQLLARRIRDLDGRALERGDQAEFLRLSQTPSGDGATEPVVRSVGMYRDHSGAHFLYHDTANADIAAGLFTCGGGTTAP